MIVADFKSALLNIDRIKAAEIFKDIYAEDQSFESLEHLTAKSLEKIGDEWENGQVSLSQVYMSGVISEELIENYLPDDEVFYNDNIKIAIGVLQDYHGLGKKIIYSVLKAGGYKIIDFGEGLTVEEIVNKTLKNDINILLISTLMLSSALKVKNVVDILRDNNSPVKVIVGGAPFRLDNDLWQKVDADFDGKNGSRVLKILNKYTGGGQ